MTILQRGKTQRELGQGAQLKKELELVIRELNSSLSVIRAIAQESAKISSREKEALLNVVDKLSDTADKAKRLKSIKTL